MKLGSGERLAAPAARLRTLRGAAPLKLRDLHRRAEVVVASPHPLGCGPIEATSPAPRPPPSTLLRTLRGAAPLKHSRHCHRGQRREVSPHPPECGPIEASRQSATAHADGRFPHPPGCGPIEASSPGPRRTTSSRFRTLRECGPIEAGELGAWNVRAGFRTFRGAAPLKHHAATRRGVQEAISAPSGVRPH